MYSERGVGSLVTSPCLGLVCSQNFTLVPIHENSQHSSFSGTLFFRVCALKDYQRTLETEESEVHFCFGFL